MRGAVRRLARQRSFQLQSGTCSRTTRARAPARSRSPARAAALVPPAADTDRAAGPSSAPIPRTCKTLLTSEVDRTETPCPLAILLGARAGCEAMLTADAPTVSPDAAGKSEKLVTVFAR